MLTKVNEGVIKLTDYVRIASENPARLFHIYPKKGAIRINSDADFTIVDLEKEGEIRSEKLHSKTKGTPFDGWRVKGIPVYTIVRGSVVMDHGQIVGGDREAGAPPEI